MRHAMLCILTTCSDNLSEQPWLGANTRPCHQLYSTLAVCQVAELLISGRHTVQTMCVMTSAWGLKFRYYQTRNAPGPAAQAPHW